jgi:hypothetical protein
MTTKRATLTYAQQIELYEGIRSKVVVHPDGSKHLPCFDSKHLGEIAEVMADRLGFPVAKTSVKAAIEMVGATYTKARSSNPTTQAIQAHSERIERLEETVKSLRVAVARLQAGSAEPR